MPMNGSLLTGEGGKEVTSYRVTKSVTIIPPQSILTTSSTSSVLSNSIITTATAGISSSGTSSKKRSCLRAHLNSLWSIWYGLCTCAIQTYIALQSTYRFLEYVDRPWPATSPPRLELHAYVVLTGTAVLLLPVFLAAALFKVGNLANDGFKLGRNLSTCSADPPSSVSLGSSGFRGLWRHSGPTAPFLHMVSAFCLLIPRLLIEARLIKAESLPRENAKYKDDKEMSKRLMVARDVTVENWRTEGDSDWDRRSDGVSIRRDFIWRTDLDFVIPRQDPLVVMSFMTSPPNSSTYNGVTTTNNNNNNFTFLPTPIPLEETGSGGSPLGTGRPQQLPLSVGIPGQEFAVNDEDQWGPVSAEILNYALALLVYAVRYPAVFWSTNKCFGALFSFQLLVNGIQSLLIYAGVCVLYKIHVVGPAEALPLLHHRVGLSLHMPQHFLLNRDVTLALFILSTCLVTLSSLVLYLYGYGRLNAFLNRERARRVISLRANYTGKGWSYFTHCAALCVLIAMAVCQAPLLYDCTVVYRGSLNNAVLACVVGSVVHLFLWVLLWLILTIKQHWLFKLRVTVGRAAVRSARSIKLVTDVDLLSVTDASAPLLVVGNGRTYTVAETSPKKAIMSVIQKCAMEKKARANQGPSSSMRDWMDKEEEQIYWLRPKPPSPKNSPDSSTSDRVEWYRKPPNTKHKVTFDPSSKKCRGKGEDRDSEDDGDYARLRELPMLNTTLTEQSDDTASEDNKLLECVRTGNVTYARTNRDLLNPGTADYEDPSPLLTPEPHDEIDDEELPPPPGPSPPPPPPPAVVNSEPLATPRCLRRADSGMPQEELTPRSDSVSTEASGGSPPDQSEVGHSPPDHSETSSGVHSNSSRESAQRRSTSVDDLAADAAHKIQPQWRSSSLQRGIQPPQADQNYNSYRASQPQIEEMYSTVKRVPQPQPPQPPHPQEQTYSNYVPRVTMHNPQEQIYAPYRPQQLYGKTPPVISEAAEEDVVIRRKVGNPEIPVPEAEGKQEPFGRATNMRLTSFKDRPQQSATLPHYPTQTVNPAYPHCSTMPLPSVTVVPTLMGAGTSCSSFPRHHTTIPTHHNGVRLFNPNPYTKRLFPPPLRGYPPPLDPGHHTFPQIVNTKYNNVQHKSERDSANFSLASSGDSDSHT